MNKIIARCCIALAAACSLPAYAGIEVVGTRVIYHGHEKEESVRIRNVGTDPVLLQMWLDKGNEKLAGEKESVPFAFNPPMVRVNKGKGQIVRVFQNPSAGVDLAKDRETLYWINFLEIPPKASADATENKLGIALRTRLKFFYRPAGIPDEMIAGAEKLTWSMKKQGNKYIVVCKNPSPYFVSFARFQLKSGDKSAEITGAMAEPLADHEFEVEFDSNNKPEANAPITLDYQYITDLGAFVEKSTVLTTTGQQ